MRNGGRGAQFIKRPNTPFYITFHVKPVSSEKRNAFSSGEGGPWSGVHKFTPYLSPPPGENTRGGCSSDILLPQYDKRTR